MMATEMPAAIRPYSMAVAPDSSFTKRETRFFICSSLVVHTWLFALARRPLWPANPDHVTTYQPAVAVELIRSMNSRPIAWPTIVVKNELHVMPKHWLEIQRRRTREYLKQPRTSALNRLALRPRGPLRGCFRR